MKNNTSVIRDILIFIALLGLLLSLSCASVGLLSDKYPEEFYKVPRLLPDKTIRGDATFLVYSDNQAGWRARDVFFNKTNWQTWKLALFPFYELYLLGNGAVGAINWYRHAPDYGKGTRLMVRDAIYDEAKHSRAKFILNVGDISAHDGRRRSHWATFIKENKIDHPLLNEIPYLPVIGNHECANNSTYGYANFQAVFDYPRFYVVEFDNAAVFVVDSNYLIDQKDFLENVYQDELFEKWFISSKDNEPAWLEQQMMNYDKPFKIVAMHHPPFSFNHHYSDWLDSENGNDLLEKRRKLLDLFMKYKVQVVFSGHDHLYQHNLLSYGSMEQIHFLVGGGGGVPLRKVANSKHLAEIKKQYESQGFAIVAAKQERFFHYYVVDINDRTLTIQSREIIDNPEQPTRPIETIVIDNPQ
ncbi:MAG: hypothetical protein GY839_18510 [candidate division Zixibacteria bacterium]|nr:hypothetical protein [candidate division Zixibacteria bacterium]